MQQMQQSRGASGPCSSSGRGSLPHEVVSGFQPSSSHSRAARARHAAMRKLVSAEAGLKSFSTGSSAARQPQRLSATPQALPVAVGFQDSRSGLQQNERMFSPMLPQVAAAAPAQTEKVGVLLLNLGGPDSLDDVQPFLYNLFADPDIIRLPAPVKFLQPLIATAISTLRAPKSSEGYKAIGGGSPLRRITEDQAAALASSLHAKGVPANVYVGMRYWHPFTEEALDMIKRDGVGSLVILPLYPQFSISTSGSSLRLLEQLFKDDIELADLRHTVIPSWYQRKGYVTAMADLICVELQKFRKVEDVEVFFSAHGVPKSYVEEAGDPYKEEMEECVRLIMNEVGSRGFKNHHTLAYQSRVGPAEWLKPYTDDSIKELGANGVRSMLAVPVSFVSEHIETLEEIDMEYRELAYESGIKDWGRVPALNTNQVFIDDLADAVVEALPFVGKLASPNDSLVPMGELETLLEAYDRERLALPSPVVMWEWGWTKSAETWNGRLAMVALFVIVLLEITTGQSIMRNLLDIN